MVDSGSKRVVVLFGGRSAEHEVSLLSARAIFKYLDAGPYQPVPLGITRDGGWLNHADSSRFLAGEAVSDPGGAPWLPDDVACVFPALHGPCGEDGTLQGWLQTQGVPFVGADTTGSATAIDKILSKRILRDAGVRVLPWSEIEAHDFQRNGADRIAEIGRDRGFPCFVKPARLGSSVGITRAENPEELHTGLSEAFRHGAWALVEPAFDARELEVAVLDGDPPVVSVPGEIRPTDWYSYQAKYVDETAELLIPAPDIQPRMIEHFQQLALQAFKALRLSGMARVDFFLGKKDGAPVLNEVNTIPGFTSISMYPRLMEYSGVPFAELCTRLVDRAVEAHAGRIRPAAVPVGAPTLTAGA